MDARAPHGWPAERPQVFCGACDWYRAGLCAHAHARQVRIGPIGAQEVQVPAEVRNQHNQCPDYQPRRLGRWLWRQYGFTTSLLLVCWALIALLLHAAARGAP